MEGRFISKCYAPKGSSTFLNIHLTLIKFSTVDTDAAIGPAVAPARPFLESQPCSALYKVRNSEYEVKLIVLRIDKEISGGAIPL